MIVIAAIDGLMLVHFVAYKIAVIITLVVVIAILEFHRFSLALSHEIDAL